MLKSLHSMFGSNIYLSRLPLVTFFFLGLFGYTLCSIDYFRAVPGDLGDARLNSVIIEHVFRWVMGYDKSLWSPPFFYPFEGVLAFSDNHFGSSIPYILLRLVGFRREVAFDGWFLIGSCLNFLAAYIALRKLGFSSVGSSTGAFIFSFSLPVLIKMEMHAQLVYRFAIPLAYSAFWKLVINKRLYLLWHVAFWCAVQFYCSIYLGVFLVYLLLATLVSIVFLGKGRGFFNDFIKSIRDERKDKIIITFVLVALSISAVLWLLYNYYVVSVDYGFKRSLGEIASMLPRLSSYLIADRASLSSWLGQKIVEIPMRHEHQMFFGFGVWIIGIVGVMSAWRGYFQQDLGMAAIISVLILFFITLNIGGYSLYYMFAYVPGINSIRAVSRIVLVMLFPIGILVAIGTEQLYRLINQKSKLRKIILFTLIMFILGREVIAYQPYKTSLDDWVSRISELKSKLPTQLPRNSILFVTSNRMDRHYVTELNGMILAQELGIPTLNGYSGNGPPGYLEPLPCYSYLNRLNAYAKYRNLKISDMKVVADRVVTIFPTPCEHEPVIAFGGLIGADQAKSVILSISDVKIVNEIVEAKIIASNNSSMNFNTVSTIGKPVRLSWRFVPISPSGERLSAPGWDARKDLAWTIAPGHSSQATISTDLPKAPGDYLFEATLVQEGVAWLQDLGMGIASIKITIERSITIH